MKIPPEIDTLMWDVAESNNTETIDEFGARYPEYKMELVSRLKMVREFKGARPAAKAAPKVFVPAPNVSEKLPSNFNLNFNWGMAAAIGAGSIVCAFAGIGIYKILTPERPVVQNETPITQPRLSKPNEPDSQKLESTTWINPDLQKTETPQQNNPPQTNPQPRTAFDRVITLQYEDAPLADVLADLAVKAGVRLQAAPGMQNPRVRAFYDNLPAITILNDLGRTAGFTPMVQSDVEALLIPAFDKNNPPAAATTGGFAGTIQDPPTDSQPPTNGNTAPPVSNPAPSNNKGILPPVNGSGGSRTLNGPIGR